MSIESVGRSLTLFFIDGKPEGMQTAEVFNWTGHVLLTPRTRIKAALDRKEAQHSGVYLLLGETNSRPQVYIGEGDNIAERIKNHDQRKDWWAQAALVSTGANSLNKAHIKYLESRLVEIAKRVGRWNLENGNTPPRPSLTEADLSNMEVFLAYLLMVLPALRIDIFQEYVKSNIAPATHASNDSEVTPCFTLALKKENLHATAKLMDGEFIVLAGSTVRAHWVGKGTEESGYARLHEELLKTGVIEKQDKQYVFVKDYAFRSPSAGAAVIVGRNANGPVMWKLANTGESYKAWEARQLEVGSGGEE